MIQSDKKIQERKVVHFYNHAKPIEGCTKFYACVWFTDDSCMFYNYIFAIDRAEAFQKAFQHFASTNDMNFIRSISISEVTWE